MKSESVLSAQDVAELRLQAGQLQSSIIPSHKIDSREAGWLTTTALGSGMDYAESRLYQQGDEPRTINWRLSARSTETYVKTYHMEARPSLCIVLDQRRSMIFGTRTRLKSAQALRFATLLASAAELHRLKLEIIVIRESIEWLEVQGIEDFLAKVNQVSSLRISRQQAKPQASFGKVLPMLSERLEKGSLVYLISDFIDLNESHQKPLFQLHDHCFIQALHITDPAEQKVQKLGGVSLQDMSSNAFLALKTSDNRGTLDNALHEHQDNIKQTLLKSAIYYSAVSTVDEGLHPQIMFPLGH